MRKQESKLTSAYYYIKSVGSFGGIQALAKKTIVKWKQIKEWLESQGAYTLHKQVRYRFPRRKTIVSGPNQQWQADLIDVSRLSRYNRGIKFLLHVLMCFPRRLGLYHSKIRVGYHLWMLLNLSITFYQKLCRQTMGQNSSIISFNKGWSITKLISPRQKMKISKQALWNVSKGHWKQSCVTILLIITRWPTQTYIGVCGGCLQSHSPSQYRYGT